MTHKPHRETVKRRLRPKIANGLYDVDSLLGCVVILKQSSIQVQVQVQFGYFQFVSIEVILSLDHASLTSAGQNRKPQVNYM